MVDRGNQAIREIQLHHDDCTTNEYDSSFHLGIIRPSSCNPISRIFIHLFCNILMHVALKDVQLNIVGIVVLLAAGFFGYMLALLQWRVRAMFSSPDVSHTC